MAQTNRPSQAEKAAAEAKRKTSSGKSGVLKPTAKAPEQEKKGLQIPFRFVTSAICIALFVILLVMMFNPTGWLVKLAYDIILGLLGRASFYIAIPGLLYLFIIRIFRRKTAVSLRYTPTGSCCFPSCCCL